MGFYYFTIYKLPFTLSTKKSAQRGQHAGHTEHPGAFFVFNSIE